MNYHAVLLLEEAAYAEIKTKLEAGGAKHVFCDNILDPANPIIEMNGICIRRAPKKSAGAHALQVMSGGKFIQAIRNALGIIAAGQRRVIIDAQCDGPVKVYLQLLGDERILSLDLETLLQGADVVEQADQKKACDQETWQAFLNAETWRSF